MIEFAHPWGFGLLLLPIAVYLFAPPHRERQDSIQVPYFSQLAELSGETPMQGAVVRRRKLIQKVLLGLAWLSLVVAMAKPELVGEPIERKKSAREIMIAVDLSGSMSEQDFVARDGSKIDRLEAAKEVLSDFAQGRQHDRLGLILFADAAYLQAPFTDNIQTWLTLLEETELGMAGWLTTIGDAIGLAIATFENAQTENRVLILLTDGADTGSKMPPIEAAQIAASYGIKIYTVAMGSPKTQGKVKLDLNTLQAIADSTGGNAFIAMDRDELQGVYQTINSLEKQQYDALSFRPRASLHHYPFALFCLLYFIALLGNAVHRRLIESRLAREAEDV